MVLCRIRLARTFNKNKKGLFMTSETFYLFDGVAGEFVCLAKSGMGVYTKTKKRKEAYEFPTIQAAKDTLELYKNYYGVWENMKAVCCHTLKISEETKDKLFKNDLLAALESMVHAFGHLAYYPIQHEAVKEADLVIKKYNVEQRKYQVFDCGRPADSAHQNLSKNIGWDNSLFNSLEEAQLYAKNYFSPFLEITLSPDEPYDYCQGSIAEIRTQFNFTE